MRRSAARASFTLVELLAVLAVVGVLAALLLPALSSARDKAWNAKCLANLRQLALANQSYIGDNDGWLIQIPQSNPTNTATWWATKLAPYLNMTPNALAFGRALQCPATLNLYGKNGNLLRTGGQTTYGINVCLSQTAGGVQSPFRLSALQSPSKLIIFADHGPIGWQDFVTPWNLPWGSTNVFAHESALRMNAGFLDGHAASLTRDEAKFHTSQSPGYPWTETPITWATSN